jgi:toxoflavin synthase
MAAYDSIAARYSKYNEGRPYLKHAVYPSFLDLVGNVTGRSVLDLACGEGFVAREMSHRGASRIVGIDLSENMLRIARERGSEGRRIEYRQGKVGELGQIGEFDIVTGSFLLHYAENKSELSAMCRDIAANLREGGVFYGINNNPQAAVGPTAGPERDVDNVAANLPLQEGDSFRVVFRTVEGEISYVNYLWHKRTYQLALRESGLSCEWVDIRATDEGRSLLGEEYWKELLEPSRLILLRCVKC